MPIVIPEVEAPQAPPGPSAVTTPPPAARTVERIVDWIGARRARVAAD
jgi:hypothetical protein